MGHMDKMRLDAGIVRVLWLKHVKFFVCTAQHKARAKNDRTTINGATSRTAAALVHTCSCGVLHTKALVLPLRGHAEMRRVTVVANCENSFMSVQLLWFDLLTTAMTSSDQQE